jgi:hypothetical protein
MSKFNDPISFGVVLDVVPANALCSEHVPSCAMSIAPRGLELQAPPPPAPMQQAENEEEEEDEEEPFE